MNERRHGEELYTPFAMSVQDLISKVQTKLPSNTPMPSVSWVHLNFWPTNPYNKAAAYYTGRLNVRYAVQQRLLRSTHPDSKYAAHQFHMMKELAVQHKETDTMICVDDKAIALSSTHRQPVDIWLRRHISYAKMCQSLASIWTHQCSSSIQMVALTIALHSGPSSWHMSCNSSHSI